MARYARGADYHLVLRRRLEGLASAVEDLCGRDLASRAVVDTAPLLERELAVAAGLGFIGKNTLLITPGLGSYTLLGALLVDLELPPGRPGRAGCGRCDLCLRACPTGALCAPRRVDARRCISYLTIEHRGGVSDELRGLLAPWVFGCDACQEVCPYNARVGRRGEVADPELAPAQGLTALPLIELLTLTSGGYRRLVRGGTALRRVSRHQLRRNAALVAGAGAPPDDELRSALQAAAQSERREVAEAARWALRPR